MGAPGGVSLVAENQQPALEHRRLLSRKPEVGRRDLSLLRDAPVDVYPEFTPAYVEIQTESLGLSAPEVEQLLTVPLEADLLNGVEGVEVSYRKRNNNPSYDYSPEGSADLNGWFGGLGHFEETSITPDTLSGFNRVRAFSHDSVPFSRFFLRLIIRRN